MLCFACTKIHDRADQKLFWRGPKLFGRARFLVSFPPPIICFAPPHPYHGPKKNNPDQPTSDSDSELSGTPSHCYFLKRIAGTNGRRIAVQIGGVLQYKLEVHWGVSVLQSLEASKAQRYKWGGTAVQIGGAAVLFRQVVRVGGSSRGRTQDIAKKLISIHKEVGALGYPQRIVQESTNSQRIVQ